MLTEGSTGRVLDGFLPFINNIGGGGGGLQTVLVGWQAVCSWGCFPDCEDLRFSWNYSITLLAFNQFFHGDDFDSRLVEHSVSMYKSSSWCSNVVKETQQKEEKPNEKLKFGGTGPVPISDCSNLAFGREQTSFQTSAKDCWGSLFSHSLQESIPGPWGKSLQESIPGPWGKSLQESIPGPWGKSLKRP